MSRRTRVTTRNSASVTPLLLLASMLLFNSATATTTARDRRYGHGVPTAPSATFELIASLRHRPDNVIRPPPMSPVQSGRWPLRAVIRLSRQPLTELAPIAAETFPTAAQLSKPSSRLRSRLFPRRHELQRLPPTAYFRQLAFFSQV